MKKIFLVMAAMLCVASVSAQNKVKDAANYVASQKWSVGLRAGAGAQVDAECFYSDKAYIEGRLGWGFVNGHRADFTILHNWNCCTWDWTPSAGQWFLDAGVGAHIGGNGHGMGVGVAGQAKFGIKFNKVPIRLAVDATPVVGPYVHYGWKETTEIADDQGNVVKTTVRHHADWGFWGAGPLNFAISATYCF